MAEETQKPAAASETPPSTEQVVVAKPITEKDPLPPAPEPEPEAPETEKPTTEEAIEEAIEAEKSSKPVDEDKIAQSASFKEESNKLSTSMSSLPRLLLHPPKEEEKAPEPVQIKEASEEVKPEEETEPKESTKTEAEPSAEAAPAVVEVEAKEEEKTAPPPAEAAETVVVAEVVETVTAVVDEDGAKTVEAIKETIIPVSAPAAAEEAAPAEVTPAEEPKEEEAIPIQPEEVFIWGIPLLGDEKSDTILLKFLRARDFKVKDAFTMIKNTVRWRKEFGVDYLLEEDLGNEWDKVVFMHGFDKEGHPVCYNVFGEFQNKELYQNTFADDEKRTKFLRWRIQLLEKSIRKLDFSPSGICTLVQVNDLKNFSGLKRELRLATNQALQLLQDNYPEFVAKQVFINVPWWYLAFNRMISPFFTQRTKSKFVFAGPSKSSDALFKYIAPEQVPVQYGGLSREGEQEFTTADAVTDIIIKPAAKHIIEFPADEKSILVWELRVLGWDVSYGAEFVPSSESSYTVIVSKTRKVSPTDEPVISDTFKVGEPGKVVLTIDNQSSKKKKLLYRSKTKPGSD
ncbi:hypothetical protein Patl1_07201 [Pistacia atlantica]|uniref:Uncharacterized protein n=1 Tax=Pistacia atlantica TaxID=434234 RepID=A0ACC1AG39_9ROSI|nr:hypothetical protein Patl1_07201 [Pistacia atlantica]